MKSSIAPVAFLAFTLTVSTLVQGQVADLDRLVKESDVVAIAQVISTEQTGSGAINFPQRQPISADFRIAKLHLKRVLKGTSRTTTIVVPYTILSTRGGGLGAGVPRGYTYRDTLIPTSTRLVFLKTVGERYEFTNGSYLTVVCAPELGNDTEQGGLLERVLSRIAAALFSADVPASEKGEAISQLGHAHNSSVVPALRSFLSGDLARNNGSLREDALVALLALHDKPVIDDAEAELLHGATTYSHCNLLLAFTYAVPASRSTPVINHIADSNANMRECAEWALRIVTDQTKKGQQHSDTLGSAPLVVTAGAPPLAAEIENAIQSAQPGWRCITGGILNAPPMSPTERPLFLSVWSHTSETGKPQTVDVNVFKVDSDADAEMSLNKGKAHSGWKVQTFKIGDEGYLGTFRNGGRFAINFRKGTVVVRISSNSLQLVQRFAQHVAKCQLT